MFDGDGNFAAHPLDQERAAKAFAEAAAQGVKWNDFERAITAHMHKKYTAMSTGQSWQNLEYIRRAETYMLKG